MKKKEHKEKTKEEIYYIMLYGTILTPNTTGLCNFKCTDLYNIFLAFDMKMNMYIFG